MPAEISPELKSAILTARPVFVSSGKITRYSKSIGESVSLTCVRVFLKKHEMRVSTEDVDGQTNFCYDGKEVVIPDAWRKLERQNWPKDVMAAMGISWEETTRIYIV